MNINLISHYDHFPNHKPVSDKPCINMYNDEFVWQSKKDSCVLLIEPRSIIPVVYKYVEQNWRKFKYIFTHDSLLLNHCPNAKLILWGWGNANYMSFSDIPKTKNISMVSSNKELCELHKARKELALMYDGSGIVDCYGTFNGGKYAEVEDYMADYRFSIILENYIDDYWFTEKILNCFANKVVPIYLGARKIGEYFNLGGVLQVKDKSEIISVIERLTSDETRAKKVYRRMESAVDDNYNRAKQFPAFEEWFYKEYGELLNEC